MIAVTIREARARLNRLIEQARQGEDVVLLRGSKFVASIVPITPEDVELKSRLTDAQAERLWKRMAEEERDGRTLRFDTPRALAEYVEKKTDSRRPRR